MIRVSDARGYLNRLRGYMFRRAGDVNSALLFRNCQSVHTCFMLFDLSLYVLNEDGVVLQIEHHIKPWRMRFYRQGAHIVEAPSSQLKKIGFSDVREGHKINVDR